MPTTVPAATRQKRLPFIDNLRWVMIALVASSFVLRRSPLLRRVL
jgi:hypothetical protein